MANQETMNNENIKNQISGATSLGLSIGRVLLLLFFFGFGFYAGKLHTNLVIPKDITNEQQNLNLFWEVWRTLDNRYPFQEPTAQEKMYGAIEGLAQSYDDDYTMFFNPSDASYFNDTVTGEFGGIGAEISLLNGMLVVVSPLQDSPSAKAGIKAGDVIVKIDETEVVGMTLDQAINIIRGDVGTIVNLGIISRDSSEMRTVPVIRDLVTIPILDYKEQDGVFIVSLYNFNQDAAREFKTVMEAFAKSSSTKLLLDLRNNPGGYLDASVDIASYFLPQGEIIVSEDYGTSNTETDVFRSTGNTLLNGKDYSVGVIINFGSASASEILAAALQDHKRAIIMGETSYGKGSVQELIDLPQETSLKVTVAKWLTPNGSHIDKKGITPNIELTADTNESGVDSMLKQAIEHMNQ